MKSRPTSLAAMESLEVALPILRAEVFAHIGISSIVPASMGGGATCDEVEEALGLTHQTISARINELMARKVIVDSGLKRLTRSNREAIVWVATKLRDPPHVEVKDPAAKSKTQTRKVRAPPRPHPNVFARGAPELASHVTWLEQQGRTISADAKRLLDWLGAIEASLHIEEGDA